MFVFIVPLLTMKVFAEERQAGTLEFLLTCPVKNSTIVLGKYLGSLAFFTMIIILTAVYYCIMECFGSPDRIAVLTGYFGIWLEGALFIAIGIIGATVMPHALFVHSWLIKNKVISADFGHKLRTLKYHLIDNVASLTIAGIINAAMLIMAAGAFYQIGKPVETLSEAYSTLIPLFGNFAAIIFALALLAAGISSSVTGTLAGQSIMDGLMGFKVSIWVRRLITRFINVIPLTIAILAGIDPLKILVLSQVVLSLLIPLPLIPIIYFSAQKKTMGELVNKTTTTILACLFGTIILGFNAYLLYLFF